MPLQDVEELVYSYKDLIKIENLWGLHNLVKLKLDCNSISKIENLAHLVRFVSDESSSMSCGERRVHACSRCCTCQASLHHHSHTCKS